jgi:hypothetical protein
MEIIVLLFLFGFWMAQTLLFLVKKKLILFASLPVEWTAHFLFHNTNKKKHCSYIVITVGTLQLQIKNHLK